MPKDIRAPRRDIMPLLPRDVQLRKPFYAIEHYTITLRLFFPFEIQHCYCSMPPWRFRRQSITMD